MGDRRAVAAIFAGLLLAGVLIQPAAAKERKCPRFRPSPPPTESTRAEEIPELPVIRVTDAATEKKPVVVEFDQEAAVWWYAYSLGRGPIVDGNRYFNVQVDTKKELSGLHVRLEWPNLAEELDLYTYYGSGETAAWSEATNAVPTFVSGDSGGPGYEHIAGFPVARCDGFVIENNAMWATPQPAQLKLWLGSIEWTG